MSTFNFLDLTFRHLYIFILHLYLCLVFAPPRPPTHTHTHTHTSSHPLAGGNVSEINRWWVKGSAVLSERNVAAWIYIHPLNLMNTTQDDLQGAPLTPNQVGLRHAASPQVWGWHGRRRWAISVQIKRHFQPWLCFVFVDCWNIWYLFFCFYLFFSLVKPSAALLPC